MTNGLIYHLPLDKIINRAGSYNVKGINNLGIEEEYSIVGNVLSVSDFKFENCLTFDGINSFIQIPSPFKSDGDFTISIWMKMTTLPTGYSAICGAQISGQDNRSPSLWVNGSQNLYYDSSGSSQSGEQKRYEGNLDQIKLNKDEWYHLVWTKRTNDYVFYINGQKIDKVFQAPSSLFEVPNYFIGKVDGNWHGNLAHFRFYDRALEESQIQEIRKEDETLSSFRSKVPLDFTLRDTQNQPVLAITEFSQPEEMQLFVRNQSTRIIQIKNIEKEHYTFLLRFRPGTLSLINPDRLTVSTPNWSVKAEDLKQQGTILKFRYNGANPLDLKPQSGELIIQGLMLLADSQGGARTTRIEFETNPNCVNYINPEEKIILKRSTQLSIVNHKGRKQITLNARFIGSSAILNDEETKNNLNLALHNMSSQHELTFTKDTTFTLRFDEDLANKDQIGNIEVSINPLWSINKEIQKNSAEWTLKPKENFSLEPGKKIEISLKNIISSKASGFATLTVHYTNIPGYWDGQLICVIEKSPLLYKNNYVGIGIAEPVSPLHIVSKGEITNILFQTKNNKKWGIGIYDNDFKINQGDNTTVLVFNEDKKQIIAHQNILLINQSSLEAQGGIKLSNDDRSTNVPGHLETDGSLYRYDQVYLTVDDHFYIRKMNSQDQSRAFHFNTENGILKLQGVNIGQGPLGIDMNEKEIKFYGTGHQHFSLVHKVDDRCLAIQNTSSTGGIGNPGADLFYVDNNGTVNIMGDLKVKGGIYSKGGYIFDHTHRWALSQTSYGIFSDERLKNSKKIEQADGLELLKIFMDLPVHRYRWNKKAITHHMQYLFGTLTETEIREFLILLRSKEYIELLDQRMEKKHLINSLKEINLPKSSNLIEKRDLLLKGNSSSHASDELFPASWADNRKEDFLNNLRDLGELDLMILSSVKELDRLSDYLEKVPHYGSTSEHTLKDKAKKILATYDEESKSLLENEHIGFLAQEVEEKFKDLKIKEDLVTEVDGYKTIHLHSFIPLIISALQVLIKGIKMPSKDRDLERMLDENI